MASPPELYLKRFSRTERALHWVHAAAFFVLLGSGLVLYLPRLSELVSRRPLVKAVHIYTALAWLIALVFVVVVGDRRGVRRTLAELDSFDGDDRRWLAGRRAPQGRFNAGQKINFWLTAAFAVLFAVSGFLLWSASATRASASPARSSSTTGSCTSHSSSWSATCTWRSSTRRRATPFAG